MTGILLDGLNSPVKCYPLHLSRRICPKLLADIMPFCSVAL